MKREEIVICECSNTEHQMLFLYDDEDFVFKNKDDEEIVGNVKTVFVHVHLCNRPLLDRIKYAVKYVFGYKCRYGAFDEFIINPKDSHKFESVLEFLKKVE